MSLLGRHGHVFSVGGGGGVATSGWGGGGYIPPPTPKKFACGEQKKKKGRRFLRKLFLPYPPNQFLAGGMEVLGGVYTPPTPMSAIRKIPYGDIIVHSKHS